MVSAFFDNLIQKDFLQGNEQCKEIKFMINLYGEYFDNVIAKYK